jgi:hypothetical protein
MFEHFLRETSNRRAFVHSDLLWNDELGNTAGMVVRRLLFLPVLSITQQQKGLFFCFINGARFSNHFERRCQGKSDSGLDIYAQNGTLCAAIDNRRYRHV